VARIHKRLRDPNTGCINPRNLQHPYPVDASALRALKRDLLKRVGEGRTQQVHGRLRREAITAQAEEFGVAVAGGLDASEELVC